MTATQPELLTLDRFKTPIGEALLVTDPDGRLRAFDWHGYESRMHRLMKIHYGARASLSAGRAPLTIRQALQAYFEGDLTSIDMLPCFTGGTQFQRNVWAALREIPVGQTWSYSDLAIHIGSPKAVRAVGMANGANPIGLVVPCHRVIGADGSLTGYGGGLDRKRWLLQHEGVRLRAENLTLDGICLSSSGTGSKSTMN
jgi:methylated-DNA-[protein]-cysteine S-methyltransferase